MNIYKSKKMKNISLMIVAMFAASVAFAQTPAAPKAETHGQAVSTTAHQTPSGPGKGATVSTTAKDNNGHSGAKHSKGSKHSDSKHHDSGHHSGGSKK